LNPKDYLPGHGWEYLKGYTIHRQWSYRPTYLIVLSKTTCLLSQELNHKISTFVHHRSGLWVGILEGPPDLNNQIELALQITACRRINMEAHSSRLLSEHLPFLRNRPDHSTVR
jgi:hypothetical protein